MDCERAEVHLRLLAEEELRRPGWAWGERRARVGRVAQLLTAMGALEDEVADRILADFDLALVARQGDAPGRRGLAAVSRRRSAAVRFRPAMPVSSRSPGSGPIPGRLVPLGQVIPLREEPAGGEVYLLSYAQTEAGPQLSLFMRSTRQAGPSGPEARSLEQFTATDDRGTRYQMMVRDLGGGTDRWTLMLQPSPPHDPQWLDLVTAPGQPAVRVGLDLSARPPQDATVTAGPVTAVALPELDGITLAILGLHNCQGRTVVHMHASGPVNQVSYLPAELYYWPVTWIRDNGGRWHATRTLGQSGIDGGTALRVEVVPPLSRATTGIEVITTGRSAERVSAVTGNLAQSLHPLSQRAPSPSQSPASALPQDLDWQC